MMFTQPTHYFVVAGHAEGYTPLNAFDQALLESGVGDTNLVRMSSILPPYCKRIEPIKLPYGSLVPVAYADMVSSEPGEYVSAAVAIGIPKDENLPGLIMEHHGVMRQDEAEETVRQMAIEGMSYRNREIKEVLSIAVEHCVEKHGAAFAGIVLWNSDTPEVIKKPQH